ncbi:VCBS repeat-containing protein [Aurantibacter crassamenti]|uniref:FG-GAP repeat domain-containing protein n=1 Tax=Aurantibacter crassamenti TaxID=1837375 RepID=UPI00193A3F14|nr:VCBS repeat-containing protein [Aurantibacter crassamenti]MBM1105833.1 VCBS repeat-containing protein [Aurantibacter crassamenti]
MLYRLLVFLVLIAFLTISCKEKAKENNSSNIENASVTSLSGESLAKAYCASCHLFPEPKLLSKKTWKYGLLPQMAHRMGIYDDVTRQSLIESNAGGELVKRNNIFPEQPLVNDKEWQLIQDYYIESAPDSLKIESKKLKDKIRGLKVEVPDFHISPPMVTAIKFNADLNEVLVADTKADFSTINILDKNLHSINTLALPSPISHIDYKSDTIIATLMGSFTPSDNPSGSLVKIFKRPGDKEYKGFKTILRNLQRPVQSTFVDINEDNFEDIIVCEYGNHTGKLSLFVNSKNGQYEKRVLNSDPGSAAVEIKDINDDGLKDMVVLMSQGKERIDVYYNQGEGDFKVETLLEFPAVYGSVSFSMVDWNKDGHEDIIYVNGDNADYSRFPKPYHGLRIFLNDGDNNFQETFFQQQNGAYKAIIFDFDKDGDIDIALTSYFPDLVNSPKEGFVFMENISVNDVIQFDLKSFNKASSGRWLIMETTDLDQNNFPELLLGSFTGMEINGDIDRNTAKHFLQNSPTLLQLKFD